MWTVATPLMAYRFTVKKFNSINWNQSLEGVVGLVDEVETGIATQYSYRNFKASSQQQPLVQR